MEVIRLTAGVHDAMLRHARAVVPAEAVGLLGGDVEGRATHGIPVRNRAGPYTFLADPFAQFEAEQQLKALKLRLLAVYHSHPGGGAQLSPLDLVFARKRGCLQIVIALLRPHTMREEMRAYRLVEDTPVEVEVEIDG
jgi:proteasome lid subunit RPN8/RPN11